MPVCPIFLCLRLAFLPTEETKTRQLRKCGLFVIDNQVFAFRWKIVAKTEILTVFLWLILTASAPGYDKESSLCGDSQRCHCFKAQNTAYSV